MREVNLGWEDRRGNIGREGENLGAKLIIDCFDILAEYPGATFSLLFQRPGDGVPYPAILSATADSNSNIEYLVTRRETYKRGTVRSIARAMDGETLLKSAIYSLTVMESLADPEAAPEPLPSWLQQFIDTAEQAIDATERAEALMQEITSGGTTGDVLRWSDAGEVVWGPDKDTTYGAATQTANGLMTSIDKTKLDGFSDAGDYALKSDITEVFRYKGSKPTFADLPATGNAVGDVWDVLENDMNYAWDGAAWDALGASFTVEETTDAEIDAILAS